MKSFRVIIRYNKKEKRLKGETNMSGFIKSEVGRGITVALISIGITFAFILPVFLMELIQSFQ